MFIVWLWYFCILYVYDILYATIDRKKPHQNIIIEKQIPTWILSKPILTCTNTDSNNTKYILTLYIRRTVSFNNLCLLWTFYLAFVKKMVRNEKTGETKVQVAARLTRGQSFGVCWLFLLSRVEIGYLLSRCLHFCPFCCWKDSIWKLNKLWSRYCTVSID